MIFLRLWHYWAGHPSSQVFRKAYGHECRCGKVWKGTV